MKIIFKNVSIYYENKKRNVVTALDDVSLSFKENALNVIIGPSGCGKTSLLKCLTGGLVYEGQILFDDKDLEKIELKDRHISYMNEEYTIFPHVNVYDNIAFPLRVMKVDHDEADQKIKYIASILDIDYLLTRKSKNLSLGQLSRVALAKALIKDNDLYLFDEPTRNLDEQNRIIVNQYIKKELANKTIIYVTHNINEAIAIADMIYVFNDKNQFAGEFTPLEFIESDKEEVKALRKIIDEA